MDPKFLIMFGRLIWTISQELAENNIYVQGRRVTRRLTDAFWVGGGAVVEHYISTLRA
jgi:hypothetical protein